MTEEFINYSDKDSVVFKGAGLNLNVRGHGNLITVGKNVCFNGFNVNITSNNNRIEIADGCSLAGTVIMKISDGNKIIFGEGSSVGGANFICGEGRTIKIGSDCMVAWNIEFRTTDSHEIFDLSSGVRVNEAQDIFVDDHVWIAAHSVILKGSKIHRGSVVALRSVVSGDNNEENVVLAGVPAKVVRKNISWKRELLG